MNAMPDLSRLRTIPPCERHKKYIGSAYYALTKLGDFGDCEDCLALLVEAAVEPYRKVLETLTRLAGRKLNYGFSRGSLSEMRKCDEDLRRAYEEAVALMEAK